MMGASCLGGAGVGGMIFIVFFYGYKITDEPLIMRKARRGEVCAMELVFVEDAFDDVA